MGPLLLHEIILLSESFIKVIDLYIDEPTLVWLLKFGCADIRIITDRDNPYLTDKFRDVLEKAIQGGRKIEVRSVNTAHAHDRIWITRNHAWGFSNSIKELKNRGKTSLVFYLDKETRKGIEEEFEFVWQDAEPM